MSGLCPLVGKLPAVALSHFPSPVSCSSYNNERRSELPWESIQSPGSWPAGCVWLLWLPVAFVLCIFSVGIYRACVCVLVCVVCACLRVGVRVWACVCVVSLFLCCLHCVFCFFCFFLVCLSVKKKKMCLKKILFVMLSPRAVSAQAGALSARRSCACWMFSFY